MNKHRINSREHGTGEFLIETDTRIGVESACAIALTFNSSATHFHENKEPDGSTSITLAWHEQPGWTRLPFPIREAKQLAEFLLSWLLETDAYGDPGYSGDGDNIKGLQLSRRWSGVNGDFYHVIVAKPEWIYYGK